MTFELSRMARKAGVFVLPGVLAAALASVSHASTVDLIVNGDFEAGDTGFFTDLTVDNSFIDAGEYSIVTNPTTVNGSFTSSGDHTTGSGNMMAINGTTTPGTLSWGQTVNVVTGTQYNLSFWVMSLFGNGSTSLGINFDGSTVKTVDNIGAGSGVWTQFTESWVATSTGAIDVKLLEFSTGFAGNDYALDDISLTFEETTTIQPVPLPAAGWLLIGGVAGLFGLRSRRRA
jgi:hypothetical protein